MWKMCVLALLSLSVFVAGSRTAAAGVAGHSFEGSFEDSTGFTRQCAATFAPVRDFSFTQDTDFNPVTAEGTFQEVGNLISIWRADAEDESPDGQVSFVGVCIFSSITVFMVINSDIDVMSMGQMTVVR